MQCRHPHVSHGRRLALEVRSQRFGFACFEGTNMLDWGVREYNDPETAARKVRSLIVLYSPAVAIARRVRCPSNKQPYSGIDAMHKIRGEFKRLGVTSVILNRKRIKEFFTAYGCRTKQQIASWLADSSPILKRILPKPRRPWTPERHVMVVFDAVATDVVFAGYWDIRSPEP
jgi:hypothetical protein